MQFEIRKSSDMGGSPINIELSTLKQFLDWVANQKYAIIITKSLEDEELYNLEVYDYFIE